MRRLGILPALVLAATAAVLVAPSPTLAKSGFTTISGDDLERPVVVVPMDQTLIWNAEPGPELLLGPPPDLNLQYSLSGGYWSSVRVRTEFPQPFGFNGSAFEASDFDTSVGYDPTLGVVQSTSGGQTTWIQVDDQRRDILDTYIALGQADALDYFPTILEVLQGRSLVLGQPIAVEIAGHTLDLDSDAAASLWQLIGTPYSRQYRPADLFNDPTRNPYYIYRSDVLIQPPQDFDINFTLAYDRTISFRYFHDQGRLVDLTIARRTVGVEQSALRGFSVPPALRELLDRFGDLPADGPRFIDQRAQQTVFATPASDTPSNPSIPPETLALLYDPSDQPVLTQPATATQPQTPSPAATPNTGAPSMWGPSAELVAALSLAGFLLLLAGGFTIAKRRT